jgi:hypothetical protein
VIKVKPSSKVKVKGVFKKDEKTGKGEKTGTQRQAVPGDLLIKDDKRRSMLRFIHHREIGAVQRI